MARRGVNKAFIVGNAGADAVLRSFGDGTAVCNLRLATTETWKDKQTQEMRERTDWHNVVLKGKVAEIAGKFVRKGTRLYVEGPMRTRKFVKDGVDRFITEVVVDNNQGEIQLLDGKPVGDDKAASTPARPDNEMPDTAGDPYGLDDDDPSA